MADNDTTVAVDATDSEPVNRFELIATYLGSTPEKVAALITATSAVDGFMPVDRMTDLVAEAVATL